MTQEEKELLLKDLCGRLQYGVKLGTFGMVNDLLGIEFEDIVLFGYDLNNYEQCVIEDVKPYLRPMSSMTEEEEKELSRKYNWGIRGNQIWIRYHSEGYWDDETECPTEEYLNLFDWLNAHHFDYRGLIGKGLALEAPEGMYVKEI